MGFLTNDKLVIVGAGGAIGSTMVQTALTMKLTPNVCLYDVYAPGMEGVMEAAAKDLRLYSYFFVDVEEAHTLWSVDLMAAYR